MASRISPPNFSEQYSFHLEHFLLPRLESFDKYISFAQKHFRNEIDKIDIGVSETKAKIKSGAIPSEYEDDVIWTHVEDYNLVNSFEGILINSLAIQLYSIMEVELHGFCNHWTKFSNEIYKVKDLKAHNDIDRVKIYLNKSMGIKKAFETSEWKFVENYREVRNKLVHQDGYLSKVEFGKFKEMDVVKNGLIIVGNYKDGEYWVALNGSDFLFQASNTIYNLLQKFADEAETNLREKTKV
jgi:hypothetical protein